MKHATKIILVIALLVSFLAACGSGHSKSVSAENQSVATQSQLKDIEKTMSKVKGVKSIEIKEVEEGIYAKLVVKDQKKAKKLAVKTFKMLKESSTEVIDLYVMHGSVDEAPLIEAFKDYGKKGEEKWSFLY